MIDEIRKQLLNMILTDLNITTPAERLSNIYFYIDGQKNLGYSSKLVGQIFDSNIKDDLEKISKSNKELAKPFIFALSQFHNRNYWPYPAYRANFTDIDCRPAGYIVWFFGRHA